MERTLANSFHNTKGLLWTIPLVRWDQWSCKVLVFRKFRGSVQHVCLHHGFQPDFVIQRKNNSLHCEKLYTCLAWSSWFLEALFMIGVADGILWNCFPWIQRWRMPLSIVGSWEGMEDLLGYFWGFQQGKESLGGTDSWGWTVALVKRFGSRGENARGVSTVPHSIHKPTGHL